MINLYNAVGDGKLHDTSTVMFIIKHPLENSTHPGFFLYLLLGVVFLRQNSVGVFGEMGGHFMVSSNLKAAISITVTGGTCGKLTWPSS